MDMRSSQEKKKVEISDEALEMIAGWFRLLSEPTRLKILHVLGREKMSVSELVSATGSTQANVSKHLGILLSAGIVSRRKEGLKTIYWVSDEQIFDLCELVCVRLKEQIEGRREALLRL